MDAETKSMVTDLLDAVAELPQHGLDGDLAEVVEMVHDMANRLHNKLLSTEAA